jgi:hypothetical protein
MGYLVAVLLIAVSVWAGYAGFEDSLGQVPCDSGDCAGPTPDAGLLLALAVFSMLAAAFVGTRAWRRENRALGPERRDGVGATLLLAVGTASVGMLLGVGALLLTHAG